MVSPISQPHVNDLFPGSYVFRVLLTASIVCGCSAALAAEPGDIASVRVGLNGYFKTGRWTPVEVEYQAASPGTVALEILAPDPDGSIALTRGDRVRATQPGLVRLSGFFRCGRLEGDLVVRVVSQSEKGDESTTLLAVRRLRAHVSEDSHNPVEPLSVAYWLTLGHPAGIPDNEQLADAPQDTRPVRVLEMESAETLPTDHRGYDAVDVVVVTGSGLLDEPRSDALQKWVQLGGHLVLAIAQEAQSFAESPVAQWLPIQVRGIRTVNELSGLENFTGRAEKIDPLNRGRYRAAELHVEEGDILVGGPQGSNSPLLARAAYGFGRVTVLALDLDRAPLSEWSVLPVFVSRMVQGQAEAEQQRRRQTSVGRLSHSGISELSTQLNAIQEHLPQARRFSAWAVLGLILLYLLVIGPLDYMLVHHALKRPGATWFTFPAFVVLSVLLTGWFSRSRDAGNDAAAVNQIDLVDIDEQTGIVRAQSWLTVYSPKTRRFEVEVHPVTAFAGDSSGFQLTWNGIPESVFGGMYRPAGLEFSKPRYAFMHSGRVVEGLPIAKSSTKALRCAWSLTDTHLAECDLQGTTLGLLEGTISHRLPVPIEDWLLAYGNRVFRPTARRGTNEIPSLQPFQRWQPNGPGVYQRELRGFLTRIKARRVKRDRDRNQEDILVEQERYDPLNLDPTDLVRMLTYHSATGGQSYTGLTNFDLDRLDYSPLLGLDRAVLFGRIDMSAVEVTLDGEPCSRGSKFAFVRILIPVTTREATRYDLMAPPDAPHALPLPTAGDAASQ